MLSGWRLAQLSTPIAFASVTVFCAVADAQPPSSSPVPSASPPPLALPRSPEQLELATTTDSEPPAPLIFGALVGRAFGLAIECPRCASDDRWAPSPTSTAPWSAGVSAAFAVGDTNVGVSVLGSRNYRLPRYMAQPLGTNLDTTPPGATAYSDLASNRTEWVVSARVQRRLKTFRGGQTLGVVADGWLPLTGLVDPARLRANLPPPAPRTDVPLLPSRAIRAGVVFGF